MNGCVGMREYIQVEMSLSSKRFEIFSNGLVNGGAQVSEQGIVELCRA